MFGEEDVLLAQSRNDLNLQYLLLEGVQQALQVEASSLLRLDHVDLLLLLETLRALAVLELQQHHHHVYCVLEVHWHVLLLLLAVVQQRTQVLLILDGEQREVLLDEAEQEGHVELVQEGFVQFWVIAFEDVQDDKDALLVELEQPFQAFGSIEAAFLEVHLIGEKASHVAEVLKEGGLAQAQLVGGTRQGDYLIEEVGQGEDDDAGLAVHDLKQPPDFEGSHAEDVEGGIFALSVAVDLLPYEVFEVDIVALAEQLHELEETPPHLLL